MKKADYKGHSNLADMIAGHIHTWRDALKIARENANPPDREEGTDDVSYWEHELKALEDIENAIKQELSE